MILAMLLGAAQAAAPQRLLDCTQIDRVVGTSREEGVPEPRAINDVQLVAHHSLCGGWEIIDMWRSGYGASAVWRARRKVMNPLGRLTVTTTDAVACPAMMSVLAELADVPVTLSVLPPPAKFDPRLPPPPPLVAVDGTTFTLRLLSNAQGARVSVSSSVGALADWAEASMKQLEPCWRPAA
ncbi:hypothetical protein [uncultured Sphingomonas sp.]|uniref:hypothetical protein n=1 Tax=uncultured Sphingomonas sp. TaxID=158754 RepID=UPI0025DD2162|nr:hypothetical protein [uncultured Sphingomonas sp.]